jgi:hypothetical protein
LLFVCFFCCLWKFGNKRGFERGSQEIKVKSSANQHSCKRIFSAFAALLAVRLLFLLPVIFVLFFLLVPLVSAFACSACAVLFVLLVVCAALLGKLVWKSNQRGNSMWKFGNKRGIQEIKWKSTFTQEKFLFCFNCFNCFACCSFAVLIAVCFACAFCSV